VLPGGREGSRRNQNGFHPLSGLFEPPEGEYIRIPGNKKRIKTEIDKKPNSIYRGGKRRGVME